MSSNINTDSTDKKPPFWEWRYLMKNDHYFLRILLDKKTHVYVHFVAKQFIKFCTFGTKNKHTILCAFVGLSTFSNDLPCLLDLNQISSP